MIIIKKLRRDGCRDPGIGDVSFIPGLYRDIMAPNSILERE